MREHEVLKLSKRGRSPSRLRLPRDRRYLAGAHKAWGRWKDDGFINKCFNRCLTAFRPFLGEISMES